MDSFSSLPIIDSHVHFVHPELMQDMLALLDAVPCTAFNLVCLPLPGGGTQNPAALFFKQQHPDRTYISGALDYTPVLNGHTDAADQLSNQVLWMKQAGFDGLKLIEGKPQVRKMLPYTLDSALYVKMWHTIEQLGLPVVLHVADPDEFWDAQSIPDWAQESGWDYTDGSFPSKETLYTEVEQTLCRHPGLKLTLAHFSFLSTDLERAAQFLLRHPGVSFDLAPHMGMYHDFSRQPSAVRDFFVRFQDRILYGTDLDTRVLVKGKMRDGFMRAIPNLLRMFLESDEAFNTPGQPLLQGISLPQPVLKKIYAANFQKIYGIAPAPLAAVSQQAAR